jgi:predicted nucleic acid-binding protein
MIVYVESNFVLEVALEQEQASSAEAILRSAESGKIELAFPNFALSEPFTTVTHRHKERLHMRRALEQMLEELRRSEPHKQIVSDLQPALVMFAATREKDISLLLSTIERILRVGKPLETDVNSFQQALEYRKRFDLSPQDSIIYAAVVSHLQRSTHEEDKCFLSRDRNAFGDNPQIKSELASYNCRYIGSFREGLRFIQRFT